MPARPSALGAVAPLHAFVAHCIELLGSMGPVRSRRMFGGHGLYVDDLFVGLILNDLLYLKSDAINRSRYLEAGCEPFRYTRTRPDGSTQEAGLSFFQPPEEAMDSPAMMLPWARLAMEAALRAANAKSAKASKARTTPTPAKTRPARTANQATATPTARPTAKADKPPKATKPAKR